MLGSGTQSDPYIIQTPSDLNAIRNNLSAFYELANDIEMSGWGNWKIILNFSGTIDGKGHVIKNLTIVGSGSTESDACAFVSNTNSSKSFTIKNLGLEDIYFNNTNNGYRMGGITNYAYNATIENCYVTGTMTANTYVGGIGALIRGTSTIKDCWTNVKITVENTSSIAGICPVLIDNPTIQNTYAIGQLSGTNKFGISGYSSTNATNNFYDIETTGTTQSVIGIGKTTAEMKQQSTYTGWDFTNTWGINGEYPYLQVFGVPVLPPKTESRNISSFIQPIVSNVQAIHPNRSTINVVSNVSRIDSKAIRGVNTSRHTKSFILPFYGDIQANNKRVYTQMVSSYLMPLLSSVKTQKQAKYSPVSFIGHINGKSVSIFPIPDINAYTYYITNPSYTNIRINPTSVYDVSNPSFAEVRE
jgi:hypothetical protein